MVSTRAASPAAGLGVSRAARVARVAARLGAGLAVFLGLVLVPFVWSSFTAYELGLYLLYGMVGQGIALCWGRAGFLPLGQALFFGIGAYLAGAGLRFFGGESWLVVPLLAGACLVPALLAGAVGALVFHRQVGSGPYFSLITLALAMLGFQLASSLVEVTGGFNGMTGIPELAGIDPFEHLYFVIVAALAVSTAVIGFLLRSPFGQLLAAVAQNEERLQFFGFRTSRLKALAYAVSAGVAGLAGALYAPHQGIVTPQAVGFLLSAELVIWTAVGGRTSLAGPVLGAVAIGFLASGLRDAFLYWEVVVALVFVVVVLRWPTGMAGLLRSAKEAVGRAVGQVSGRAVAGASGPSPLPKPREPAAVERGITLPAPAEKPAPNLRFDAVDVRIGSVEILKGLSFEIDAKAIHCLIGPNGAGKTSALNALTGKLTLAAGGHPLGRRLRRRREGLRHGCARDWAEVPGSVDLPRAHDRPERRHCPLGESAPAGRALPHDPLSLAHLAARKAREPLPLSPRRRAAGRVALGGGTADARFLPHHARRARPRAAGRALCRALR